MPTRVTLASLSQQIPDEAAAYEWLESIRWPNGPVCPHCGVIGHAYHLKPKGEGRKTRTGKISQRKVWKCGSCRKQFTVTVGTCMEGSKIPVRKWVLAFHTLSAAKNGMSSHELGRQLDISHESAWFMSHRIRYALAPNGPQTQLEGTVEADETYIGGHAKTGRRGAYIANKTVVVSLVERNGEVRSKVVPDVSRKTLDAALREHVNTNAHLMTDQYRTCVVPGQQFASHETVNHQDSEYVRGKAHTNTVEGVFSQLNRSLDGTHHQVAGKQLHRYVNEFDFRYNIRKESDGERTARAIKKSAGKRHRYQVRGCRRQIVTR